MDAKHRLVIRYDDYVDDRARYTLGSKGRTCGLSLLCLYRAHFTRSVCRSMKLDSSIIESYGVSSLIL